MFTKAEISAILDATPNLKHKAMIATMYSGGLRVSEVTHLHYDDISRTNKTIHIRDSKSRFDRYTLLADRTLEILTEYWFKCDRPTGILFPSSWSGDYLVKDSVILILSILVYTLFSRMFDLMQPPVVKHSIAVA